MFGLTKKGPIPTFEIELPLTSKVLLLKQIVDKVRFWEDRGKPEYAQLFQNLLKEVDKF